MNEEQSIQVKFNVDSSELDEAQAKAEKLVETLEKVNELGKVIEKGPFSGSKGSLVSKENKVNTIKANTIKIISNRRVILNNMDLVVDYVSIDSRKSSTRPEVTLKIVAVPY